MGDIGNRVMIGPDDLGGHSNLIDSMIQQRIPSSVCCPSSGDGERYTFSYSVLYSVRSSQLLQKYLSQNNIN